jgi:hypothetical protein
VFFLHIQFESQLGDAGREDKRQPGTIDIFKNAGKDWEPREQTSSGLSVSQGGRHSMVRP